MSFKLKPLAVALLLTIFLATTASAEFLLCISNKELKGEETVGSCVTKGERFAVVDEYGLVRILSPEEIALTKVLNSKVFETRAFSYRYIHLAPELPPLPLPSYVPGG
jgi:hypothetical protein